MKTTALPARFNTQSLDSGLSDRVAKIRSARRAFSTRRQGNLGQRIEDGMMLTLALAGFGSIGWSLFALR